MQAPFRRTPLNSLVVRLDDGEPISLMQLFVENEDLSDDECLAIEAALNEAGEYHGGGGAAAEYVIRLARAA